MTDTAPVEPGRPRSVDPAAPAIKVTSGHVVTGLGFLPHRTVTIRVTYTADDVSDYLAFCADTRGELFAQLPTTPTTGMMQISATDHRAACGETCGLLWSNTQTVRPRRA
jgi:hypothetical protein